MDDAVIRKIKQVVAGNFDKSFARYQDFEEKHNLFADLTRNLAQACNLDRGCQVLDIGCGNGASAEVLSREFECRVVGLDLSPEMIAAGRRRIRDPHIRLEVGDAVNPQAVLAQDELNFDAALYNASIFIIPDAEMSLKAVAACLRPGATIGFTFYPQILDQEGIDLFPLAFDRCHLARPKAQVVTSYEKALKGLQACCNEISESAWERPFEREFLNDFFSIPAQSASLFPRLQYAERRQLIPKLFSALTEDALNAKIVWRLAVGKI